MEAPRDQNYVPTALGVSSVDHVTTLPFEIDPITGRVLTDNSGGGTTNFADGETPSGAINGSNVTFTLAHTPSPALSLQLFKNGQLLSPVGVDYTLVGLTITLNAAPQTGPPNDDVLICWYRY